MEPAPRDLQGAETHPGHGRCPRRLHHQLDRRREPVRRPNRDPTGPRLSMMPIASARMYSWSPSLTAAWHRLLVWVSARAEVPLAVLDLADPLPLDEIWRREDLGCVFMCGYPWALRRDRPHLLAAPVPSPLRYGGRPIYFTDFVVREDSPFTRLEDTFGGCLAYSTGPPPPASTPPPFHLLPNPPPIRPRSTSGCWGPSCDRSLSSMR